MSKWDEQSLGPPLAPALSWQDRDRAQVVGSRRSLSGWANFFAPQRTGEMPKKLISSSDYSPPPRVALAPRLGLRPFRRAWLVVAQLLAGRSSAWLKSTARLRARNSIWPNGRRKGAALEPEQPLDDGRQVWPRAALVRGRRN